MTTKGQELADFVRGLMMVADLRQAVADSIGRPLADVKHALASHYDGGLGAVGRPARFEAPDDPAAAEAWMRKVEADAWAYDKRLKQRGWPAKSTGGEMAVFPGCKIVARKDSNHGSKN